MQAFTPDEPFGQLSKMRVRMAAIGQARLTPKPFRHLFRWHRWGYRIALGYVGTKNHHSFQHPGIFDPFHDHHFPKE